MPAGVMEPRSGWPDHNGWGVGGEEISCAEWGLPSRRVSSVHSETDPEVDWIWPMGQGIERAGIM